MSASKQLEIAFASETPVHRERDRPKKVKFGHWSALIDRVCLRGGVPFTHEAMIRDLHRCCPEFCAISKLADLGPMHIMRWEWYWERWHPEG